LGFEEVQEVGETPGADENSATDMRAFADTLFSLLKKGAESIVVLHHTPKNAGDTMSLENALRGSGDLGACLTCCFGTRLQDPEHIRELPGEPETTRF
jgi:hypothetical protein